MKKRWYSFILMILDYLIEGTSKDIAFHRVEMERCDHNNNMKWAHHFMQDSDLSKRLVKMRFKRHIYQRKLNEVLQQ